MLGCQEGTSLAEWPRISIQNTTRIEVMPKSSRWHSLRELCGNPFLQCRSRPWSQAHFRANLLRGTSGRNPAEPIQHPTSVSPTLSLQIVKHVEIIEVDRAIETRAPLVRSDIQRSIFSQQLPSKLTSQLVYGLLTSLRKAKLSSSHGLWSLFW